VTLKVLDIPLELGAGQDVDLVFGATIDQPRYVFVCLMPVPGLAVHLSNRRVTGVLSVTHNANKAVAKSATQSPPPGIGVDTFEFWTPQRRPGGRNFALRVDPPLDVFGPANVANGFARPATQPNAWVADFEDAAPAVTLAWREPQQIGRIDLSFDTDFDHPMESVLMGHPERDMPFCVRHYRILDAEGRILVEVRDNHQTRRIHALEPAAVTSRLTIECLGSHGAVPAALFEVRCYGP
jgi:hypothetical protein